jgi:hypothetical protein
LLEGCSRDIIGEGTSLVNFSSKEWLLKVNNSNQKYCDLAGDSPMSAKVTLYLYNNQALKCEYINTNGQLSKSSCFNLQKCGMD